MKLLMRIIKTLIFSATVIFIIAILVRGYLNYHGYCFKQGRYIPDQEKIDIAVGRIFQRIRYDGKPFYYISPPTVWYEAEGEEKREKIARWSNDPYGYRDLAEFYKENPDCCRLVRKGEGPEGPRVSFWSRIAGGTSAYINIRFTVRYVGQDGEDHLGKAEWYTGVSNCGHLR